jgi:hypothetical protein
MNATPTDFKPPLAFNTPMECGLRSAVLLGAAFPTKLDLQRLVQYDYLLVHSGDIAAGPPSIHPPTPNRSGELLVRRPIIEAGIKLMMTKSVVEYELSRNGIVYCAGKWSLAFLDQLVSNYTKDLKNRAEWVVGNFAVYSDDGLLEFMRGKWSNWGAEFEMESFMQEPE